MATSDLQFVLTLFLMCMGCFSVLTTLFVVLTGFRRRHHLSLDDS